MCIRDSLTGTNFFERIEDDELNELKDVWNQSYISENDDVYRSEFLAYNMFEQAIAADHQSLDTLCLLYTSDAADDLLCVDLGGRRINKKKNTRDQTQCQSDQENRTNRIKPSGKIVRKNQ
eukprot:TRINITY_DN21503_c0_g1_i1.p1 TRINITY_DN21503_c0_g1~~TRINITY_DN21503_c0_g1_i1.p1  ORF type:complete len:121 (-),score=31.43 TRINITY_DN21503_c0_g1_i1:5-367(-)